MKRNVFMIIASILATFFGAHMLIGPGKMLENVVSTNTIEMQHVLQWGGCGLIAIGIIIFLARNDQGSQALKAIMIGNILLHVLAFGVDLYQFNIDFIKSSGLIMGAVVHGLLIFGFSFYLAKLTKTS